jgi:hypothetical protein
MLMECIALNNYNAVDMIINCMCTDGNRDIGTAGSLNVVVIRNYNLSILTFDLYSTESSCDWRQSPTG